MIITQNWRRWGGAVAACALVAACVNAKFKTNEPLHGFVIADEPRAAQVGRDILQDGGTAVDAAVAATLTMAVSLPSRVGLAGGGVCVVFDAVAKTTRTLDFLPRPVGGGGTAMPALARGMAVMHARGGKLRWEKVAVAAEQEAYRGPEVSRALAQDLGAAGAGVPAPWSVGGAAVREGGAVVQNELGALIGAVRRNGPGAFYTGRIGTALAQASGIPEATLAAYQPQWRDTVKIPVDYYDLHFPALPDGIAPAALQAAWKAGDDARTKDRVARGLEALTGSGGGGTAAPGAGVLVIDGKENAAACAFTMGGLFGTGRTVAGAGVILARPTTNAGFGMPALLTNTIVGRTKFGAVATAQAGDPAAAAAQGALAVALPGILDEVQAPAAIADRPASRPGRINAVTCQGSRENLLKVCQMGTDPRVPSLAYTVETDPSE